MHCLRCRMPTQQNFALCCFCIKNLEKNTIACLYCAQPLAHEKALTLRCGACLNKKFAFDTAFAPFIYSDEMNQIIKAFKFQAKLIYGAVLSQLFVLNLSPELRSSSPQLLIPIASHRFRVWRRGFNQAAILAKNIASLLNLPVALSGLKRKHFTPSQIKLAAKHRALKQKSSFTNNLKTAYDHVVLIDDVITTGSTAHAAATCLKTAGIKRVDIWAIARALK